ncbi:ribosomal protein L7/L12 [Nannocystaceae bacterium ST9]
METYRIRYLDGGHVVQAVKLVREFTALGLREAKEIVETGGVILDQVTAAEARRIADQFAQLGAQVEVERTWRYMLAFDPGDPARGDQQLQRLRVGERELELEVGELGGWAGGERESYDQGELVARRVVELLGQWHARGLSVAEDELAVLERVSAREPRLEQRLRSDPDELETRLIYGDWLQARGDPRGQLIALSHALERAAPDAREPLRVRVEEFKLAHAGHLFGPLRHVARDLDLRWRCGMIDAAFVGPLAWSRLAGGSGEVLAALLRLPVAACMTKLAIGSSLLGRSDLESTLVASPVIANLRELELGDVVRGPSPRHVAPLLGRLWPHLRELRRLALFEERPPLRSLHSATLEHLELHLRGLPRNQRLHGLPDGLHDPFVDGRLPQLRILTLEFIEGQEVDPGAFADLLALPDFQGIRQLELRFPGQVIAHDLVETFAAIPKLGSLERLELSRCVAERRSIKALVDARARGRLPVELRLPRPSE